MEDQFVDSESESGGAGDSGSSGDQSGGDSGGQDQSDDGGVQYEQAVIEKREKEAPDRKQDG
jgi:hypothetical protein